MTAAALSRHEPEVGCVLSLDVGVVVVLTDHGPVRATYGARMLSVLARDRSCTPEPGEWVSLRRWPDGPVTVEGSVWDPPSRRALATVVRLRPRPAAERAG